MFIWDILLLLVITFTLSVRSVLLSFTVALLANRVHPDRLPNEGSQDRLTNQVHPNKLINRVHPDKLFFLRICISFFTSAKDFIRTSIMSSYPIIKTGLSCHYGKPAWNFLHIIGTSFLQYSERNTILNTELNFQLGDTINRLKSPIQ